MKTLFLFFILSLFNEFAFAQKEAAFWYFGDKIGFDFNNGSPKSLTNGAMLNKEGCAVMADKQTGELLFHANGRYIWNQDHQLMAGSKEHIDTCRSFITQSALILPFPGQDHLYYVFTLNYAPLSTYLSDYCLGYITHEVDYSCELRYSLIDMRLEGGKGGIIADTKHTLLAGNMTQKLTAIPHSNGKDFWLLTHLWNSNAFYAYLISAQGIAEPVSSYIGSMHQFKPWPGLAANEEMGGYMKASPDGTKLACAVSSNVERPFDLFDFDASTGSVKNYVNLGNLRGQYGVSFSPDNTKLYVITDSPPTDAYKEVIRQYDLQSTDPTVIATSAMSIVRNNPFTNIFIDEPFAYPLNTDAALQIGLDGKIYCAGRDNLSSLLVINKPNEKGFACEVDLINFGFAGFESPYTNVGLPNFIQSYFNNLLPIEKDTNRVCEEEDLLLFPNPTKDWIHIKISQACLPAYKLRLVTAIGQILLEKQFPSNTTQSIDIRSLPVGIYLMEIEFLDSPKGKSIVKKLVKSS